MTTVGEMCDHLDAAIPFAWAEEWDRVGLSVGDRAVNVERVFVALDASASALRAAVLSGSNVMVTHHPAFLEPPERVVATPGSAGVVLAAAREGVSLIACHTNLDRSPEGAEALPRVLGLEVKGPLERRIGGQGPPPAGRLCGCGGSGTLGELAALVGARLGVQTRVWGDSEARVASVAVAPGSGRMLVEDAIAVRADVLVTGELRYHVAHDALERGLAVIEAGHDATEWPLTEVLAEIVGRIPGVRAVDVVFERPPLQWRTI